MRRLVMRFGIGVLVVMAFGVRARAAGPMDLNDGLVGYWSFDEGSGDIAFDSSGTDNHGAIHGALRVAGVAGTALYFDGLDDYVQADPVNVDYLTAAVWVMYSRFFADASGHAVLCNGLYPAKGYMLYQGTGWPYNILTCFVCTDSGAFSLQSIRRLFPLQWYHLIMSYDGEALKLYIDGELDSQISASGKITPSSAPCVLLIGSTYSSGGTKFQGAVDQVRIYNRALTEPEILYLYEHPERVADPDVDRNGCVNVSDFVLVRINLGQTGSDICPVRADVDCNGIVNVSDLVAVRISLGQGCD